MVVFPQRRHILQAIFSEKLNSIVLAKTDSEQIGRSFGTDRTQIDSVSEHRPLVVDSTELGVFAVIELASLVESASNICICSRLGSQTIDGVGSIVLRVLVYCVIEESILAYDVTPLCAVLDFVENSLILPPYFVVDNTIESVTSAPFGL